MESDMPNRKSPKVIRDEVTTALAMWSMNPELSLPDMDLAGYQKLVNEFDQSDALIRELGLKTDAARVAREEVGTKLSALYTRLRSATRGLYGPNSTQVSQVGMVRSIERKNRRESASASAANPT